MKNYLNKPAYHVSEIEKTKSVGTIQLSKWIRSLVAYNDTKYLQKKSAQGKKKMKVDGPYTAVVSPGLPKNQLIS